MSPLYCTYTPLSQHAPHHMCCMKAAFCWTCMMWTGMKTSSVWKHGALWQLPHGGRTGYLLVVISPFGGCWRRLGGWASVGLAAAVKQQLGRWGGSLQTDLLPRRRSSTRLVANFPCGDIADMVLWKEVIHFGKRRWKVCSHEPNIRNLSWTVTSTVYGVKTSGPWMCLTWSCKTALPFHQVITALSLQCQTEN